MPTLEEALAAVFDEPAPAPAASETPETPAPATTAESAPAPETPAAEASSARPDTDPETPAEAAPAPDATPKPSDAPPPPSVPGAPDVEDLKAIKERIASDHPELQPVLNAALKEMERGLARKFEQVAALRKEAAEQIVSDERLKGIPPQDLLQMAEWHRLAATNPQAAADHLFAASEQLRQQAQSPPQNPNPYQQLPPEVAQELDQMRAYYRTQTEHQLVQQIEGQFAKLTPEFGGSAIPETQRLHTLEVVQQRGLGIEDIGLVWKGLYGADFAKQQGIKQGQTLRAQKQGLSAGSPAAAPPPAPASQPKTLEEALEAVCTAHGLR